MCLNLRNGHAPPFQPPFQPTNHTHHHYNFHWLIRDNQHQSMNLFSDENMQVFLEDIGIIHVQPHHRFYYNHHYNQQQPGLMNGEVQDHQDQEAESHAYIHYHRHYVDADAVIDIRHYNPTYENIALIEAEYPENDRHSHIYMHAELALNDFKPLNHHLSSSSSSSSDGFNEIDEELDVDIFVVAHISYDTPHLHPHKVTIKNVICDDILNQEDIGKSTGISRMLKIPPETVPRPKKDLTKENKEPLAENRNITILVFLVQQNAGKMAKMLWRDRQGSGGFRCFAGPKSNVGEIKLGDPGVIVDHGNQGDVHLDDGNRVNVDVAGTHELGVDMDAGARADQKKDGVGKDEKALCKERKRFSREDISKSREEKRAANEKPLSKEKKFARADQGVNMDACMGARADQKKDGIMDFDEEEKRAANEKPLSKEKKFARADQGVNMDACMGARADQKKDGMMDFDEARNGTRPPLKLHSTRPNLTKVPMKGPQGSTTGGDEKFKVQK